VINIPNKLANINDKSASNDLEINTKKYTQDDKSNNIPMIFIEFIFSQYICEPYKTKYIPDNERNIHGTLSAMKINKSCSIEDKSPDGKNIKTNPKNNRGLPKLLLLNAGPILCRDKPQKSIKNPNQNCMSDQSMHTGL
tara:strand:+ start:15528 stop:15944 length:417 start_codon:yes stop_codon:yes gene_type:complete